VTLTDTDTDTDTAGTRSTPDARPGPDPPARAGDHAGDSLPRTMTPRARRPKWRIALAVAASACAITAGVVLVATLHHQPVNATPAYLVARPFNVAPAALPPLTVPDPGLGQPVPAQGAAGCTPVIEPSTLIIPSICVNAPLVTTTRAPTGALQIPGDVHDVGLWDDGAPLLSTTGAADPTGTTLLAGHVNDAGQGNGALFDLYQVQPGALVYATDAAGRTSVWRVVSAQSILKADLPAGVFAGPQGPRQVVIVTCGGSIHYQPGVGWTYDDNIVVTAVPASNP
jgi:hypothetical protein